MRKIILLTLVMSGCAFNPIDPNLPPNVVLTKPDSQNTVYVDSINFKLGPEYLYGNPAKCLALKVNNDEYQLSDSSRSFVGQASGKYYDIESSQTVGGGQSILYSDSDAAVAKGTTAGTYTVGFVPITEIVKFKVLVALKSDDPLIEFSEIQVAQESTGNIKNTGMHDVGAWTGGGALFVYSLLEEVSNELKDCLLDTN